MLRLCGAGASRRVSFAPKAIHPVNQNPLTPIPNPCYTTQAVNLYPLTARKGWIPVVEPQRPEKRLLQSVELGTLLACYGGLLTDKQREALRLHCGEDLSLSEIAGAMDVTRQNVHELIARSEAKLRRYEAALHLAAQAQETRAGLQAAIEALDAGHVQAGRETLARLLTVIDEEEP